jgi:hypothetical protein
VRTAVRREVVEIVDNELILRAYSEFVAQLGIAAIVAATISRNIKYQLDMFEANGMNPPESLTHSLDWTLTLILLVPLILFGANILSS